MPRRATPLDPKDGPQARFALALRRLRDSAGFDAKTIEAISAESHIPASTLYAAMRGTRVPTIPVLAALVLAWNGDPDEWLVRRTNAEQEIERLRRQSEPRKEPVLWRRAELSPEEQRLVEEVREVILPQDLPATRSPALRTSEAEAADLPPSESTKVDWGSLIRRRGAEPEIVHNLMERPAFETAYLWHSLRQRAGAPSVRQISFGTGYPQTIVAQLLKGAFATQLTVQAVVQYLLARGDQIEQKQAHRTEALGE